VGARILIVEDEPAILELLEVNLRHAGYRVAVADSAESARSRIDAAVPDLVLLDWMLPGQSGIDFTRRLRCDPRTQRVPIVLLTARAQEGDKLQGFDVGADDYITKPFSPRELLARLHALLRRSVLGDRDDPIEIAGLRLEPAGLRVLAGGQPVGLSPTEFRLLQYFMSHPDRVLTRARLLDNVWGDHVYIEERTVDVHIRRLRMALARSGHDRLIETVRGVGYRLLPC